MKLTYIIFILLLSQNFQAQLYLDMSENLPVNGATRQSMDVQVIDIDLDDDIDIILANEFQSNTVLRNNGLGQFTESTPNAILQNEHDSEDVVAVDLNGDGFPELVFCSEDDVNLGIENVHEYYISKGDSYIVSSYHPPDSEANALISFDINEDDFQDLFFGNNGPVTCLINNGDGTFTDESQSRFPATGRTTQDLLAIDIDDDRDFDLFEANENGNILYVNNGDGIYSDESSTRLPSGFDIETRKASKADIDNDGDEDIFLSNVVFINGKDPQNRIYINDGNGFFTDETSTRLPVDSDHTVDAIFEDVDLDGDPDLFVANVFGARVKVYKNDGNGFFIDATDEILGESYFRNALGIIAADFDDDGFRDIYICDRNVNSGNKDVLLMRRNTTSVFNGIEESQINIFPIPAEDLVNLKFPAGAFSSISISNPGGEEVFSLSISNQDDAVDLKLRSNLSLIPGTYVITFNGLTPFSKTIILLE